MEIKIKNAASSATRLKITDDHLKENYYKVSKFFMKIYVIFKIVDITSIKTKDGWRSWGIRLNLQTSYKWANILWAWFEKLRKNIKIQTNETLEDRDESWARTPR